MKKISLTLVLVTFSIMVRGNGSHSGSNNSDTHLELGAFLLVVALVGLAITGFLVFLHKSQSKPGTLPMRSIAIAVGITYILNALLFGYYYVEM